MVTKEQAIAAHHRAEFHAGTCSVTTGPRGGVTRKTEVWRVNGACKTWKTRPADFSLPLKYGFKGPYTYLTQDNAGDFHASEDCTPVDRQQPLKLHGPMMPLGGGSSITD